ncbi:hypothetical protein E4P42_04055 [Mycobacterium sp. PS03-16]|uniref:hypothetical protein n=1 Tax=Mycobacterium sp. PS03-16 TaxID=2559611 RepID=UPI0010734931|nr:hypothetical protein [Mycobacterium sp. PS03-16]TFV60666.1 hypothetical protein E4P42_04055 [Mycobacterium sp. PS03-16]
MTGLPAAERWFLRRGLPAVLTPGARWRGVVARSAPGLAAWAVLMVCSLLVLIGSENREIDIDDDPGPGQWFALAVLVLMLPLMAAAAWATARCRADRTRRTVAAVSIAAGLASDLYQDGPRHALSDTLLDLAVIAAILVITGTGLGAVLAWALRVTATHLASVGHLVARALPVVLLTVLVFFNGYVWSMAATISAARLWVVVAFMAAVAISFLVTSLLDRVRPMLAGAAADEQDHDRLDGSPFAGLPDPDDVAPLRRIERANVLFVAVTTQVVQIVMVSLATSAVFLALGLLMLSPPLLTKWTSGATAPSVWLGFTVPVPAALLHVAIFLGALTFMYISARTIADAEYRREFLDPLVDDLRLTLVARHRYRARVTG